MKVFFRMYVSESFQVDNKRTGFSNIEKRSAGSLDLLTSRVNLNPCPSSK